MKILVCISHVPDTTTKIKFSGPLTLDTTGIQWIINPWDELALTRALELKESTGTLIESITAINVGKAETEPTLRKALAIGADAAVRINTDPADSYVVAAQIAEYLKKDSYDLIFCGIESSDFNGVSVGAMLGEFLDMTYISAVSATNINGSEITVDRDIDGGREVLAVELPFIAIVQKGITKEPRIPSMRGIMSARTKPLTVAEPAAFEQLTANTAYEMPRAKASCKIVDAENVAGLVELLKNEAKVI